jgi:hypothetical protein
MEKEAPLNQFTTVEQSLEQQGEELWQQYTSLTSSDNPNATDQVSTDFWQQYFQLIQQAQQYRLVKNTDKALALANETFLSNEQQFKSVPIPQGQFFYKAKGIHPKMQRYLGMMGIWGASILVMAAELISPSWIPVIFIADLFIWVYLAVKMVTILIEKGTVSMIVGASYIRDKASGLVIGFKDIQVVKETRKGLLIKVNHITGEKRRKLLIPKNIEEYNNLSYFIKQIAAVNEQQPNIYPSLPAIKDHHWASPTVEFTHNQRLIVSQQGWQGIDTLPLGLTNTIIVVGCGIIAGVSIWSIVGGLGAAYTLRLLQGKKRFHLKQIQVTQEHLLYTFSYNGKLRTIHIPLKDIYGLRVGRRGIKILNAKGKAYWQTLEYPHKKYMPILPKNMSELPRLQIFLEEVVAHNKGLG